MATCTPARRAHRAASGRLLGVRVLDVGERGHSFPRDVHDGRADGHRVGRDLSATSTSVNVAAASSTYNIYGTAYPPENAYASGTYEVGAEVHVERGRTIPGVRFYKQTWMNTNTETGHLWSSTGDTATAKSTARGPEAGSRRSFSTPVAITAGTTYVVSFSTGGGESRPQHDRPLRQRHQRPPDGPGQLGRVLLRDRRLPEQGASGWTFYADVVVDPHRPRRREGRRVDVLQHHHRPAPVVRLTGDRPPPCRRRQHPAAVSAATTITVLPWQSYTTARRTQGSLSSASPDPDPEPDPSHADRTDAPAPPRPGRLRFERPPASVRRSNLSSDQRIGEVEWPMECRLPHVRTD